MHKNETEPLMYSSPAFFLPKYVSSDVDRRVWAL